MVVSLLPFRLFFEHLERSTSRTRGNQPSHVVWCPISLSLSLDKLAPWDSTSLIHSDTYSLLACSRGGTKKSSLLKCNWNSLKIFSKGICFKDVFIEKDVPIQGCPKNWSTLHPRSTCQPSQSSQFLLHQTPKLFWGLTTQLIPWENYNFSELS